MNLTNYQKNNYFLEYKKYDRPNMIKILKDHNLYLINNNGCRNYCINYGKNNGYKWTFVLDSNSFHKSFSRYYV